MVKWILRIDKSFSIVIIFSYIVWLNFEEKFFVLFYRDNNVWCFFCERVWFVLEEK